MATKKLEGLTAEELEVLVKWKNSPSHKVLKKYLEKVRKPHLLDGYSKMPLSTMSGGYDREVILAIKDLQSRMAEDEYIVDKLIETAEKRLQEINKIKKAKGGKL